MLRQLHRANVVCPLIVREDEDEGDEDENSSAQDQSSVELKLLKGEGCGWFEKTL